MPAHPHAKPSRVAQPPAVLPRVAGNELVSRPTPPPGIIARDQPGIDQAVLAAALDPIITIDSRGIIQSASNSVLRVLGWTPGELLGRNINILMPEPHHAAHDGYLANYHRTGQTNIMNRARRFDALHKNGTHIPIELCVSRAEIPGGGPPLFVGIIRDMSAYAAAERSRDEERVHSQQLLAEQTIALQTAHLQLRMADRMASIGTLAAGLGHDMNNVLLPVRARLNALRAAGTSGKIPALESKHVEEIRKSIAYLQQLADGLHFLALDPDTEEDARGGAAATDLRQWWSQTGPLLSKAVPKHVCVSASFPADLPHAAVAAHGLTQAALNLVVNAGESIPGPPERKRRQGHVRIWAEAIGKADGEWIRLGVTDNGSGMTEDVKRRAFEMFFTTKPRGLGTGLGLALVRKVVDRAGGTVEIESEVGKGTTVVMIVPAARSATRSICASDASSAVISLRDGRAAALIRHLLEVSGPSVRADQDASRAETWVVSPMDVDFNLVKAWRADHPNGRLVLFGTPDSGTTSAWSALKSVTIDSPDDLEAIRAALGRAPAAS
jgi:PAS domain S-box-containing protein